MERYGLRPLPMDCAADDRAAEDEIAHLSDRERRALLEYAAAWDETAHPPINWGTLILCVPIILASLAIIARMWG